MHTSLVSLAALFVALVANLSPAHGAQQGSLRGISTEILWGPFYPSTHPTYASLSTFITMTTGDSIMFQYSAGTHNVASMSSEQALQDCDMTKSVELYGYGQGYYIWNPPAAGTYYFTCQTAGHCAQGWKLKAVVTGSPPPPTTASPPPRSPSPSPPPPKSPSPSSPPPKKKRKDVCGAIMKDSEQLKGTLLSKSKNVASYKACCKLCGAKKKLCKGFTYGVTKKECSLMKKGAKLAKCSNCLSGVF